eukprot:CAMPEP_0172678964 /NCGR_PEP_ID=MMETSP1074-20121228/15744_1 /TAXON_ID=2916 /ORGANISM="Ceratium fusus, Strain PA161109" /LENGTH=198 /DNA_ID=CAMNT_0013497071 /DNA_START=173 /DNA_END=769 /DNA_ORIENTATION=-
MEDGQDVSSPLLTICGLAGQVQIAVQLDTTVADLKAQAAAQLGLDTGSLDVPWELVLSEADTGREVFERGTVQIAGIATGRQLVLVRRQKRLYTPLFTGVGCYLRREDGTFENALPLRLSSDEEVLRRLDNKEYPWVVNGFEIPNKRMVRFQVALANERAGREVYVALDHVKQITQGVKAQMGEACKILGRRNPFEDA